MWPAVVYSLLGGHECGVLDEAVQVADTPTRNSPRQAALVNVTVAQFLQKNQDFYGKNRLGLHLVSVVTSFEQSELGGDRRTVPASRQWKDLLHERQTLTSEPSNDMRQRPRSRPPPDVKISGWEEAGRITGSEVYSVW
jgi:hypothetical protein